MMELSLCTITMNGIVFRTEKKGGYDALEVYLALGSYMYFHSYRCGTFMLASPRLSMLRIPSPNIRPEAITTTVVSSP